MWYTIYRNIRRINAQIADGIDRQATLHIRASCPDDDHSDSIALHLDEKALDGLQDAIERIKSGEDEVIWEAP